MKGVVHLAEDEVEAFAFGQAVHLMAGSGGIEDGDGIALENGIQGRLVPCSTDQGSLFPVRYTKKTHDVGHHLKHKTYS